MSSIMKADARVLEDSSRRENATSMIVGKMRMVSDCRTPTCCMLPVACFAPLLKGASQNRPNLTVWLPSVIVSQGSIFSPVLGLHVTVPAGFREGSGVPLGGDGWGHIIGNPVGQGFRR